MKYLLSNESAPVVERFAASRLLAAFDFDGTLAPIVAKPERARMRASTLRRLARVAERYPCAVLSGRARADVMARLGGVGFEAVVGNHGIEPSEGMQRFAALVAGWSSCVRQALSRYEGILIEDKTYSIAIHYRACRDARDARARILELVARLGPEARMIPGKCVVNVVPADAPHKGIALGRLLGSLGLDKAIYVGDDVTDEDVFAWDRAGRVLCVRVGRPRTSSALFYLRAQSEVDVLLDRLIALRQGGA